jgi:hypothetical protein
MEYQKNKRGEIVMIKNSRSNNLQYQLLNLCTRFCTGAVESTLVMAADVKVR